MAAVTIQPKVMTANAFYALTAAGGTAVGDWETVTSSDTATVTVGKDSKIAVLIMDAAAGGAATVTVGEGAMWMHNAGAITCAPIAAVQATGAGIPYMAVLDGARCKSATGTITFTTTQTVLMGAYQLP